MKCTCICLILITLFMNFYAEIVEVIRSILSLVIQESMPHVYLPAIPAWIVFTHISCPIDINFQRDSDTKLVAAYAAGPLRHFLITGWWLDNRPRLHNFAAQQWAQRFAKSIMWLNGETSNFAECRNHDFHLALLLPCYTWRQPGRQKSRCVVAAVMKVCRDQSRNELPETIVTLMKRTR